MIQTSKRWKEHTKDTDQLHIRATLTEADTENLIDGVVLTDGAMLIPTNGQIVSNASSFFTDYIRVEDGVTYNTNLIILVYYNASKQWIGGRLVSSKTFDAHVDNETVVYVRMSGSLSFRQSAYIYEASTTFELTDEDFMFGSVSFTDSISGMGSFNVGSVIANTFEATLNNFDGKFDDFNLASAKLAVQFGYTTEWINRGVYTLENPTSLGSTIQIIGYDNIAKFDRYFTNKTNEVANAFDKTTITTDKIISRYGNEEIASGKFYSDYIPISKEGRYATNFDEYVVMYGITGGLKGYSDITNGYVDIPAGVAYVIGNGTTANVNSYYFNSTYADITYPQYVGDYVELICDICGVEFDTDTKENLYRHDDLLVLSYQINPFEFDEETTFRDVLAWIAQSSAVYFRADPTGKIQCLRFATPKWDSTTSYNGGTIDPWAGASNYDGGTIDPWSTVTAYNGGSLGGADLTLSNISSLDVYSGDISITGFRVFSADKLGDADPAYEESIFADVDYDEAGTNEYMLEITGNPLIKFAYNLGNSPTVVADSANRFLRGFKFRPFEAQIFGDPSIEAGDTVALTDYKGVQHISIITDLKYTLNAIETLSCNAQTPEEMNKQRARI